jgi:hypothetical protein
VLAKAAVLFQAARLMGPEPNKPLEGLNNAAWQQPEGGRAPVGVATFGSSSVMDDMALAAGWLAVATGARRVASACAL